MTDQLARARVENCLKTLYHARDTGHIPEEIKPEQMDGVIKGLEFAIFVIDHEEIKV